MKKINLAIVGATGMVGRTFLKVLEERNLPINNLYIFASKKSAGQEIAFMGKNYIVEELTHKSFEKDIDIALFSAGGDISKEYAPIAVSCGVIVVDNSSAWRMKEDVPLVVPEVNPEDIKWHKGIIANPNCSTIQAVVALKPLHEKYGIKRIVYSTYQAVSGAGAQAIDDLLDGDKGVKPKTFIHPIAKNCIPQIDIFEENGYTKEENKMINETKKILHASDMKVTATTVRIPVITSHSESINVEFNQQYDIRELVDLLKNSPGIVIEDDIKNNVYPMPINTEGLDDVFIGRIRRDFSLESGLNMWVVSDNLRKGAATNTVQIAEEIIKGGYVK